METIAHYYRVDRRQINMVKFIFEAYEGVAAVTTLDVAMGTIRVATAPGCEAVVKEVMADLAKTILVEECGATPFIPETY